MSKIKIIESDYALHEDILSLYEKDGLTLISVNHVVTSEYPTWTRTGEGKQEVVRWTYHFRVHFRVPEEAVDAFGGKQCACSTCSAEVSAGKVLCNACEDQCCGSTHNARK